MSILNSETRESLICDALAGVFGREGAAVAALYLTVKSFDKVIVLLEAAERLEISDIKLFKSSKRFRDMVNGKGI